MPLINNDAAVASLQTSESFEQGNVPAPLEAPSTLGQATKAAWQNTNWIGSLATFGADDNDYHTDQPGYNPIKAIQGTPYENNWEAFVGKNSPTKVQQTMARVDQENKNWDIINNAGTFDKVAAVLAAGIVDPLMAVPIFGAYKYIKAGKTLYSALTTAGTFGGIDVASQSLLNISQPERPFSSMEMATSAVLGGVLGAGMGALGANALKRQNAILESIFTNGAPPSELSPIMKGIANDGSAGAARVGTRDVSLENLPNWLVNNVQVPFLHSPSLDMATSSSPLVRDIGSRFYDMNLPNTGSAYTSMESLLRTDRIMNADLQKIVSSSYKDYLGTKDAMFPGIKSLYVARRDQKLSLQEYNEEFAKAFRRSDESAIPEINSAAKEARAHYEQNIFKPLQELGILEKDLKVKTAPSWLTRIYDIPKVSKNPLAFKKTLSDYYISKGVDPVEAAAEAQKNTDDILGLGDNQVGLSDISRMSLDKGVRFTKDRTLDVPDEILEPFLVNDFSSMMNVVYTQGRQMIRMQETLNSLGVKDLSGLRQAVKNEYSDAIAKGHETKVLDPNRPGYYTTTRTDLTNKELEKAAEDLKKNLDRVNDTVAVMLGQYATRTKADRFLRLLKTYNYTRIMGYVLISSLTDPAAMIIRNGMGKVIMDGYVAEAKDFAKGVAGLKHQDLRDMGVALDAEMEGAMRMLLDQGYENPMIKGKAEQIGDVMGDVMSKATGIHYWNVFNRRVAGRLIETRILRTVKKSQEQGWSSLTKKEINSLKENDIDEEIAGQIAKLQEKHGTTLATGTHISNVKLWRSTKAGNRIADIYSSGITKEVNNSVITPGKGDIPLLFQGSQLGSALGQMKGFFAKSTSALLLSGVSRHDANTAQALFALVSLGSLQYIIRQNIQGKEPNLDSGNLLYEGVNRSGILGLLGDPMFAFVLNPLLGKGPGSRYMNQNPVEYMFGPSASVVKILGGVASKSLQGKFDQKTLDSMGHLIPYQNLFWLKMLMDKVKK